MEHASRQPARQGPQRIVCLSTEAVDVLYRLNQQHKIVGISGFSVHPPQARREKPKVSAYTSAKIDQIVALEPDLVLGFSDLQADLMAQLVRLGHQVHVFNQRTIEGIVAFILDVGRMVDAHAAAQALVAQIDEHLAGVAASAPEKTKPRVYFEEWDEPMICGIEWVSQLIDLAGGVDVFADKARGGEASARIINDPMAVIEANPDIIIGSWCGKAFQPDRVRARRGFDQIAAVVNGRLHEVKSAHVLQPGPTTLINGLDQLCRIIRS